MSSLHFKLLTLACIIRSFYHQSSFLLSPQSRNNSFIEENEEVTPRKTEAPPDQTPLKFHKLFQERMKSESELFDQQMQAQNNVHQPHHHHHQQQPYQNAGAPPGFHQRDALRQVIVTPRGGEDDNLLHNGSGNAANLYLNKFDIHMMMGGSTSSNDDHHHGSSTVTDTAELLRNLRMAMRNNEMMNCGGGGGRNGNELRTHHMPETPPRQYLQWSINQ